MDIGNQIRSLRLRRGVTQEAVAQRLNVTAQAVSKWERGAAVPDISLLPELSAYFGVTIDELFSLSDETRMTRIQNMLWDERFLNPADADNERRFLQEKTQRDPTDTAALELLANLELHMAQEHCARAEEYALVAIRRNPASARGHCALAHAMGGRHVDPRNNTHNALISHYKNCIAAHPEILEPYPWLIAQLVDDGRLDEAEQYCDRMAQHDVSICATTCRIMVLQARGDHAAARALWEQLGREHPGSWSVWHWIGDFQTRAGDYAAAKESYRRAIGLQTAPHEEDPIDSLAQVCEMDGDIAGALDARREQLRIAAEEWQDTAGESVDAIRRELLRLEKLC